MTAASVWSGLGRRGEAAPQPDADLEQDEQPFEHRVIPAAGPPSIVPPDPMASPFTSWRRAGSVAIAKTKQATAAAPSQEKPTMSSVKASPRVPHNLQVRVVRALAKAETMTREKLIEQLPDLTAKQISQAIYQASAWGRVRKAKDADGARAWEITTEGEKYLNAHGGDVAEAPAATTAKPAKARKGTKRKAAPTRTAKVPAKRAKPGRKAALQRPARAPQADKPPTLAARTSDPLAARSFRAAIFTDGAFHLAKGGKEIDLTPAEHKELLRYMDRMAVEEAA